MGGRSEPHDDLGLTVKAVTGKAKAFAANDSPAVVAMNCRRVSGPIGDKLGGGQRGSGTSLQNLRFAGSVVYGSASMRSWTEGVLAIVVVVAFGAGLFLFTGESFGDATTDTTTPIDFDADSADRGQILAESKGCLQCHTIDGTPSSGPTWKGLAGSSRPLVSGESVIADNTYLLNSIVDPSLQIVQGFDAIMPPDYGETLSNDEITDLINYINSLAS